MCPLLLFSLPSTRNPFYCTVGTMTINSLLFVRTGEKVRKNRGSNFYLTLSLSLSLHSQSTYGFRVEISKILISYTESRHRLSRRILKRGVHFPRGRS